MKTSPFGLTSYNENTELIDSVTTFFVASTSAIKVEVTDDENKKVEPQESDYVELGLDHHFYWCG